MTHNPDEAIATLRKIIRIAQAKNKTRKKTEWEMFTEHAPEHWGLVIVLSDTFQFGRIYFAVDFTTGWGVKNFTDSRNHHVAWRRIEHFD